jgi:hypothetical protein
VSTVSALETRGKASFGCLLIPSSLSRPGYVRWKGLSFSIGASHLNGFRWSARYMRAVLPLGGSRETGPLLATCSFAGEQCQSRPLDQQLALIDHTWPQLAEFYGRRIVHVLASSGIFMTPEEIFASICSS